MSDSRHVESLVKFLGASAAPGHAFAVLGLERMAHPDAVVLRALNMQLARVASHPHSSTPEADEVRMILHTAAAQLMTKRRAAEQAGAGVQAGAPRSNNRVSQTPIAPVVLAEMQVIVARHGGMAREAMAELSALAEREKIELADLLDAFASPPSVREPEPVRAMPRGHSKEDGKSAGPALGSESAARAGDIPEDIEPAARTLRHAVLIAGVAVIAVLIMAGVIVAIVRSATAPASRASGGSTGEEPTPDAPRVEYFPAPSDLERNSAKADRANKADDAPSKAHAPPSGDAPALVHQLETCLEEINVDAGSATSRFASVLAKLAECWDQLASDQLLAAQDRIVEFVYRVGGDATRADELVKALRGMTDSSLSAGAMAKRAFAAGVFARLSRERDLPGAITREVTEQVGALGLAGGNSFRVGARAALVRASSGLVKLLGANAEAKGDDPWAAWLRLVDAVSGSDEQVRERLIAGAVESILFDLAEPINPAGERAARRLLAKLTWREGSPARRRVIGWFSDPRMTAEDLSLITSVIAGGSAPGVDRSMVLARDADPAQRDRLREVYEAAWGEGASRPRDELVAEWQGVARQYLERGDPTSTPSQTLARAVVLSRLCEAASRIWTGEDIEPAEIVKAPESTVLNLLTRNAGGSGTLGGEAGGEWAVRYISAKTQPSERLRMLGDAAAWSQIGAADAEVLAAEAIRGNPSSIRRAAAAAVRRHANDPQIVNAMLEQAYLLPKTSEVVDLAEQVSNSSLPPTRDATWRAAVRRALVERLLQLLASEGDDGAIDALSQRYAETYAARQIAATTDRLPPDGVPGSPIEELRKTLSAWDRLARSLTPSGREPLRLDQVERRAEARAKNARGIVQQFAADQVTLAETMAYAISCERPARSGDVARVLDDLAASRRTAEHVMTQIRDTERAMLELWIIRLEGGR